MPLRHEGKKNGSSPLKGEIGDDMLSEASLNHGKCQPPMSFQRGHVGERESIRGGLRSNTFN